MLLLFLADRLGFRCGPPPSSFPERERDFEGLSIWEGVTVATKMETTSTTRNTGRCWTTAPATMRKRVSHRLSGGDAPYNRSPGGLD